MSNIRNKLFIVLSLVCIAIISGVTSEWSDVFHTNDGPIRGKILRTGSAGIRFASFTGIPYAKSPTGYRRFRPPVPVDPWESIFDANNTHVKCPQLSTEGIFLGSEDCLILNVYTPITNTDIAKRMRLPVMVWIHGGSFTTGDSNFESYRPDYFLEKGVIVASINYRLSSLGFLNLNHPNATGNAQLKDQVLALQWVKHNIHNFGGHPNKVTIFGQSSGATSVGYHVLSKMSKGLFRAAILQSGSPSCPYWGYQKNSDSVEKALSLSKSLGISSSDPNVILEHLYEISDEKIISASMKLGYVAFRPTVEHENIALNEEKFLTQCPEKLYKTGKFNKVSQIVGFTADEGLTFLPMTFGDSKYISELIQFAKKFGIEVLKNKNASEVEIMDFSMKVTDLFFVSGIDLMQKYLAQRNPRPVFYYRLSYNPSPSLIPKFHNLTGVAHGDDLPYLFHKFMGVELERPDEILMSQKMVTMWTNFAKYLHPTTVSKRNTHLNKGLKVIWPSSGIMGLGMDIGSELAVRKIPVDTFANKYEAQLMQGDGKCE